MVVEIKKPNVWRDLLSGFARSSSTQTRISPTQSPGVAFSPFCPSVRSFTHLRVWPTTDHPLLYYIIFILAQIYDCVGGCDSFCVCWASNADIDNGPSDPSSDKHGERVLSQTYYSDQLRQAAGRSGRLPSCCNKARQKEEHHCTEHTPLNTSMNQIQHTAKLRQGLISRYEGGRCCFQATESHGSSETQCRSLLMNETRKKPHLKGQIRSQDFKSISCSSLGVIIMIEEAWPFFNFLPDCLGRGKVSLFLSCRRMKEQFIFTLTFSAPGEQTRAQTDWELIGAINILWL